MKTHSEISLVQLTRHIFLLLAVFGGITCARSSLAQLPSVADSRLGVDQVRLESGQRLYGFVLEQSEANGIVVAVERVWLTATYPELAEQKIALEKNQRAGVSRSLLERIELWKQQRAGDDQLIRLLEFEAEKIERELLVSEDNASMDASQFFRIEIPTVEIRSVKLQDPGRRHVAGIAFQNNLADVTITPAGLLAQRLEEIGVDPAKEMVDLSARLPKTKLLTDRKWAAKQAFVEYQYREPLEYQGTGSTFFRVGEDVDAADALQQMLAGGGLAGSLGGLDEISQIGAELGLPEFKQLAQRTSKDWWESVTQKAEKEGYWGVLITRLNPKPVATGRSGQSAQVTGHFFAFDNVAKEWFEVQQFMAANDVANQSPEQLERLKQDPQVQQVVQAMKLLGLGVDAQLSLALGFGAATEQSLRDVRADFSKALGTQIESLSQF